MKSYLRMIGLFILLVALHQGLALLYLVPVATYYTVIGIEGNQLEEIIYSQSIQATIFAGFGALFIFWIIFKNKKENLFVRSQFNSITKKQAGWSALIGFSFVFLSMLIVQLLSAIFPSQYVSFLETMDAIVDAPFLAVLLAVVIVAPLFEEVMFRGLVYDALQKRMNIYLSVILAGLFFGIYHLNIFQGTYATLIGIIMGLSLVWTKSIWAPIIIHFVNNLISVLLSYTVLGSWLDLEKALPIIISIVIAITLLPFGIYKLYLNKVENVPIEPIIDESLNQIELDATV
jgi:uncharacterized protein